jgi:L-ascorbate metabolism protein UlaG (beta-lactamase superfamily)
MYLTWLDSNSWLLEIGSKNILIDPWLVGELVFGKAKWFFRGYRNTDRIISDRIDLILLSQGLEDHAHPPTLEKLDRNIPVVGSPNAIKVVKNLGYTTVTSLNHGESFNFDDLVKITATKGSPIGPNLIENGYIITEINTGYHVYYEPHGFHPPELKEYAPIDVVITPLINLELPLIGPIIQGQKTGLELAKNVQPQVMLPSAAGGDIMFEGLLLKFLKATGNLDDLRQSLQANQLQTKVIEPTPGVKFILPLTMKV